MLFHYQNGTRNLKWREPPEASVTLSEQSGIDEAGRGIFSLRLFILGAGEYWEVNPCPFCGGTILYFEHPVFDQPIFDHPPAKNAVTTVSCAGCRTRGPATAGGERTAVLYWNGELARRNVIRAEAAKRGTDG